MKILETLGESKSKKVMEAVKANSLNYEEIAKKLGVKSEQVSYLARLNGFRKYRVKKTAKSTVKGRRRFTPDERLSMVAAAKAALGLSPTYQAVVKYARSKSLAPTTVYQWIYPKGKGDKRRWGKKVTQETTARPASEVFVDLLNQEKVDVNLSLTRMQAQRLLAELARALT